MAPLPHGFTKDAKLILGQGRFDTYVTNLYVANSETADGIIDASQSMGGVLDVSGNVHIYGGYQTPGARVYLSEHIDVRFGSPSARSPLVVGNSGTGVLDMQGTNRFEAYLTSMSVGSGWGDRNIFYATNFASGLLNLAGDFRARGNVALNYNATPDTMLNSPNTDIVIGDNFVTTIGDPGGRVEMRVASREASGYVNAIKVKMGGMFSSYLSKLVVGEALLSIQTRYDRGAVGRLDLTAVTNGIIDVAGGEIIIGVGTAAVGQVWFPRITVLTADLTVGNTHQGSRGTLIMTGTVMTVTGSVTIDGSSTTVVGHPVGEFNTGRIMTTVLDAPAGLDLADGATLTVENGLIHLTFEQPPEEPLHPNYWGLRWAGDKVAQLEALETVGKLTWTDNMTGNLVLRTPEIYFSSGYTYVGARMGRRGTIMTIR